MKTLPFIFASTLALVACSGGGGGSDSTAKPAAAMQEISPEAITPLPDEPSSVSAAPQPQSQAAIHHENGLPAVIEQF
ncbi:hypothetical protein [Craterilacuibacter sp. RT1T]|uniref:hypothetical protein n=1 Tax=Craterilacuibacter sp. RT1T TaxID=2942211 RepID=UPI0020C06F35|nr:hypothetical protein [Craterilacuibacter sp. RT1T]MCL6263225.1 hypothetical protein [Craterilacuibacter sp. RT1T]